VNVWNAYVRDLRASFTFGGDAKSCFRLVMDFTLARFLSLTPRGWRKRVREVRLRGNVRIRYRLNRGDLHSIREIWFEDDYRLPFENSNGILLDLGANIGMASVWLAKQYQFTRVIAVEPDPTNAALARANFELNGIDGQVMEAAVGPKEGTARFEFSELSNLGRLSESGSLVQMVSVNSIIKRFAVNRFALVKIDIEGAEQELFDGPTEWLTKTDAMIMELHPHVDCSRLTQVASSQGFRYIPAHSFLPDNLPCFTKTPVTALFPRDRP
jgi:FkbM family methyltransferase